MVAWYKLEPPKSSSKFHWLPMASRIHYGRWGLLRCREGLAMFPTLVTKGGGGGGDVRVVVPTLCHPRRLAPWRDPPMVGYAGMDTTLVQSCPMQLRTGANT